MSGRVIDGDGQPVEQVAVSVVTFGDHGAKTITVFTNKAGAFDMLSPLPLNNFERPPVVAKKIGYEQVGRSTEFLGDYEAVFVTLTVSRVSNQAAVAPASAWLAGMDEKKRISLIRECASCHQMPAPEVRNYARLIADSATEVEGTDFKLAGIQSWEMIQRYMNLLPAEEIEENTQPWPSAVQTAEADNLPVEDIDSEISEILAGHFVGPMDHVTYSYGAPLLATPRTVMRGYLTQSPNTGGEALQAGATPRLWISADGTSETIIAIDLETGQPGVLGLPMQESVSTAPHTLQRDAVGNLWIIPHLSNVVGLYDPDKQEWIRKWRLNSDTADFIAINSLSIGYKHEVVADGQGRIWFFDHNNNSLGSFSPATGDTALLPALGADGQKPPWNSKSGGLVMSSGGKQVWYCQPDTGSLLKVSTESHEIETLPLPAVVSGPGQIAISDEDVVFVPLFETGQLFEYDTRTNTQTVHDLPDRASAPRASTFDPVRRVIWITTANGDLIYRFDPRSREFAVLPIPGQATQMETIAVDPVSNMLVGAYGHAGAKIKGQGMVLTVDPGDGLVRIRPTEQAEENSDAN